ncbi:MAG: glycosyltransferase family 2 protein [Thermoanaerobaculales bacterium]
MSVELSVVIPVFNEEANIPELFRRLDAALSGLSGSHEIVMVDDGSTDRTWAMVGELAGRDPRVKGVRFSRNFGHQMAFTAGLDHADGDAVVIMDGDLQDPPELIPELVARWREGYDVVYAVRGKREGETAFKLITAAAFYRLMERIARIRIPVDTGDFRLMSRRAADALRRLPERHRFTRGLVAWLGFPQTGVTYARAARHAGETKYPLRSMLRLASDGITSFSYVPLQLATWLGLLVAGVSLAAEVALLGARAFGSHPWTWTYVAAALGFVAGLQLLTTGALGAYVGRIHDEVKRRPLYLVQDTIGFGPPNPG